MSLGSLENAAKISALSNGTNTDVVSTFKVSTGFDWVDPPIIPGLLSEYYPNDYNYHPLIDATDYEIANNLFSIEASDMSREEKDKYSKKVETIVKDGMYLLYRKRVINTVIIICVLSLIVYLISRSSGVFIILVMILGIYGCYEYMYGLPMARSSGYVRWNDYNNTINAMINTGTTPQAVLNKLAEKDQLNKLLIQSKYNSAGIGSNVNMQTSTSFTGALLGSALGSYFKK